MREDTLTHSIETTNTSMYNTNTVPLPSIQNLNIWMLPKNYSAQCQFSDYTNKINNEQVKPTIFTTQLINHYANFAKTNQPPSMEDETHSHEHRYHPYSDMPLKKRIPILETSLSPPLQPEPTPEDHTTANAQKAVRRRVSKACQGCQTRHVKCGADRPCTRCTAHGIECVDVSTGKKRGRKSKKQPQENSSPLSHSSSSSSISSSSETTPLQPHVQQSSPLQQEAKMLLPSIHQLLHNTTQ